MKKRKLGECVSFIPGINQSRAEKQFGDQEINYYDQSSFETDYKHDGEIFEEKRTNFFGEGDLSLSLKDIVISNSLQQATMVGKSNLGKMLSLNFTKVELKDDQLDKSFFLYLFNVYRDVQRQKERELQGSGPIRRLTRQSLEQITIPIVPLEEQIRIGAIYTETLKLQNKLNSYADLMEQFTSNVLEKSVKEYGDEKPKGN